MSELTEEGKRQLDLLEKVEATGRISSKGAAMLNILRKANANKEYQQGFFKTYEKKDVTTLPRKADVLAAKAANFGMNVLNAPFELAGEAVAAPMERRLMTLPTVLGGEGAADPVSQLTKTIRSTAAGVSAPLRGQDIKQQFQAEYSKQPNKVDAISDAAINLSLPFVAPRVANAPVEALANIPELLKPAASKLANISKSLAIGSERRALGIKYPELKTEFARGKAYKAAEIALENKITSKTGSPDEMLSKAKQLKNVVGKKLENIRESAGEQSINPILSEIDNFSKNKLKGATGGEWKTTENKIEKAKETIKGLVLKGSKEAVPETQVDTGLVNAYGQKILKTIPASPAVTPRVSLNRVVEAKKQIEGSVNWLNDNVSQKAAKGLVMAVENGITKAIAESGGDIKTYQKLKPIYGAAKTMEKNLNLEIGANEGRNAISLPSMVAGAATGGPPAVVKIGAYELLKRRGAGISAHNLNELSNAASGFASSAPNVPGNIASIPAISESVKSLEPVLKELTQEKAKQYLKKALKKTKGDIDKARIVADEDARKDGYDTSLK